MPTPTEKVKIAPNSKESEMMVLGCMLTSVNSLNIAADGLHEIRHANQRRVALVQTDDRRFRRHREMLAIASNDAAPTGGVFVFTAHLIKIFHTNHRGFIHRR